MLLLLRFYLEVEAVWCSLATIEHDEARARKS
jgi:hypothetical protein